MKISPLVSLLAATSLGLASLTQAQSPANSYPFAKGTIAKLDPTTKQLALTTPRGTQIFSVTDKTYLIDGIDVITFDKLKPGDLVAINYSTNATGQAVIRRLKIKLPGPDELPDKTQ